MEGVGEGVRGGGSEEAVQGREVEGEHGREVGHQPE